MPIVTWLLSRLEVNPEKSVEINQLYQAYEFEMIEKCTPNFRCPRVFSTLILILFANSASRKRKSTETTCETSYRGLHLKPVSTELEQVSKDLKDIKQYLPKQYRIVEEENSVKCYIDTDCTSNGNRVVKTLTFAENGEWKLEISGEQINLSDVFIENEYKINKEGIDLIVKQVEIIKLCHGKKVKAPVTVTRYQVLENWSENGEPATLRIRSIRCLRAVQFHAVTKDCRKCKQMTNHGKKQQQLLKKNATASDEATSETVQSTEVEMESDQQNQNQSCQTLYYNEESETDSELEKEGEEQEEAEPVTYEIENDIAEEDVRCVVCNTYDKEEFWVQCDKCSDWYHKSCAGILSAQWKKLQTNKAATWSCRECLDLAREVLTSREFNPQQSYFKESEKKAEQQVTYKSDVANEGKFWVQCDKCSEWCHHDCTRISDKKLWKKIQTQKTVKWSCKECLDLAREVLTSREFNPQQSNSSKSEKAEQQVTYKSDVAKDGEFWVQCDKCSEWCHRDSALISDKKLWKKIQTQKTVKWSCQECLELAREAFTSNKSSMHKSHSEKPGSVLEKEPTQQVPYESDVTKYVRCVVCKTHGKEKLWIQCDKCDDWLHRNCSGMSDVQWKNLQMKKTAKWSCRECLDLAREVLTSQEFNPQELNSEVIDSELDSE